MAKIARTNFQKVVDVLGNLETYWGGARYIRSVLIQKGEGVAQISLVGGGDDDEDVTTVPPGLSEWIANASTKQDADSRCYPSDIFLFKNVLADLVIVMGLSFSGTIHSPNDSRFSVVYPSKGAHGQ